MKLLRKTICTPLALAAFSLACVQSANADEASGAWDLFHGAPKYKLQNGNYWKLRGRIMWDIADLSETLPAGRERSINESEFRAARIGVEGKFGDFKYVGELDFAGSKTSYKDVNIKWSGPITIQAGQMKAGGSLEELTSGRHTTFMERGMVTDAFGFDRRLGVQIAKSGKNYGISGGVFGNSIDGAKEGNPVNTILAARGYYVPVLEKGKIIHVGATLRHTDRARGAPKHSARWGAHLAKEKVKPSIGGDALLFGFEAATIQGPFHLHSEYLNESGDFGSAKGGFIQAGYFITGETRTYKGGKFNRTKPTKPLSAGGVGAFEVAARFETLDARSAGDEKADAFTLGLNWYPESHLRVSVNYTDASGDKFEADGLQMRLQMDW